MNVISKIVRGSIKHQAIVRGLLVLMIGFGVFALVKISKDEFPFYELKQGLILAVYPGADVNQVQEEVGKPLESLLFSMKEIDRTQTRLNCRNGLCYIYTDLRAPMSKKNEVWSKIKLKIQDLKSTLPPGVLKIMVLDDFSEVSSLLISIESSDKGYSEMKEYAEDLADRLRAIPQLANATVIGAQDEEIAVTADMDKLSAYGISPASMVMNYQTGSLMALGGSFNTDFTSSPIYVPRLVTSEQELSSKIIYASPDNHFLRLSDVAKIERRYQDPSVIVNHNGNTAIVVSVEMIPGFDIVAFGKKVDTVLGDFMKDMPDSVSITRITDQPKVVSGSVWSFLRDLVFSMFVVILVMLLLFPFRSALIASSGVPVCTIISIALMFISGITLNTVSLAALMVVLGMIVDDSVITMDGYMNKLDRGMDRVDAACESANELFTPMLIATSAIGTMFIPMTFILTDYLRDFVQSFPWIVLFSLMTSLAYAVLVVPSLEVRYIKSSVPTRVNFVTKMQIALFKGLQNFYDSLQNFCFRHAYWSLLAGLCTILLGLLMFSQLNVQMMPMAPRPFFAVEVYLPPSASFKETEAVSDSLSTLMRKDPRITSVTEFIGTGTPRFHCTYQPILPGKNVAQLIVNTKSNEDTESFLRDYESKYDNIFPDAIIHFAQMSYQSTNTPVEVVLSGEDYQKLVPVAEQIKSYLQGDDDLKWVHSDVDNFVPAVSLEINSEEASRLGVNRSMMNLSLAGEYNGLPLTSFTEGTRTIPVNLYASRSAEESYDDIANSLVPTYMAGMMVPVRQVARMVPEFYPENLIRVNGMPTVTVGADVRFARSEPVVSHRLKKFIKDELVVPAGVKVELGGLDAGNHEIIPDVIFSFLAAVAVLFLFLLMYFKKFKLASLTILMSSLCLFGASLGLWLFKFDFGMTSVLGLISLVGIIVRNGIILFEYAETLRLDKGMSALEAAEEAGKRRIRPIFLTSCTTALGVLPMVIAGGLLWQPMGVVICFGTLLSIFLIALLMPIAYWQMYKNEDNKIKKSALS